MGSVKCLSLYAWKHSGFHVHADADLLHPANLKGRQRLAEHLLRAPFSLQKITWNADTKTVIYRSRRSWHTTRNIPPPPDPPFDIDTFEPIDPLGPAIRVWIPADDTDPEVVYPEDIVSTRRVPTEICLDDERTLVLDPS